MRKHAVFSVCPPADAWRLCLPVKLQRNLHAALAVRLHTPQTPVVVLKRGGAAQGPKQRPVQQVERLPAEFQALLFALEVDAPGQRQVLVVIWKVAQLGIVPGLVAEPGGRLWAEERHGLQEAVLI